MRKLRNLTAGDDVLVMLALTGGVLFAWVLVWFGLHPAVGLSLPGIILIVRLARLLDRRDSSRYSYDEDDYSGFYEEEIEPRQSQTPPAAEPGQIRRWNFSGALSDEKEAPEHPVAFPELAQNDRTTVHYGSSPGDGYKELYKD